MWLPIIGLYSFLIHFGGWNAIRRVSFCTRIWGYVITRILNIRIKVIGEFQNFKGGLIVSNHLGYLDILVHASLFPIRFAPKMQIKKWPLLGPYLGISRPIWIDRSSRQKAKDVAEQFKETMIHGIPLLVYPEGTSTSGEEGILEFKSTPFEAVAEGNFPILPLITSYERGKDGQTYAWYGDITLFPHFWKILSAKTINVEVHIMPVIIPGNRSRKELAEYVHKLMLAEYNKIKHHTDHNTDQQISSEKGGIYAS
jgi:1-acyl-sn-glycerol-3-phosphate acyltransferase